MLSVVLKIKRGNRDLKIKRGNRDILGFIIHYVFIFLHVNIFCNPSIYSIPIYSLQRGFLPPKFGKNDVPYMLLDIEGTK